jgi:hypothetical protein
LYLIAGLKIPRGDSSSGRESRTHRPVLVQFHKQSHVRDENHHLGQHPARARPESKAAQMTFETSLLGGINQKFAFAYLQTSPLSPSFLYFPSSFVSCA